MVLQIWNNQFLLRLSFHLKLAYLHNNTFNRSGTMESMNVLYIRNIYVLSSFSLLFHKYTNIFILYFKFFFIFSLSMSIFKEENKNELNIKYENLFNINKIRTYGNNTHKNFLRYTWSNTKVPIVVFYRFSFFDDYILFRLISSLSILMIIHVKTTAPFDLSLCVCFTWKFYVNEIFFLLFSSPLCELYT